MGSIKIHILKLTILLISAVAVQADPHPDTLRVLSYNTWYVFNHKKEITAGKKWVNEQTPDIVALQELTSIKPELLQSFAESWSHPHSALLKSSGFSVGITSRWPIRVVEKQLQGMHHGYLHVTTAGIHVFAVHLSPFKYRKRMQEAQILLKKIKPLLRQNKRVIVLGDFNAVSSDDSKLLNSRPDLLKSMQASDKKHGHVENLRNGKLDFQVMDTFFKAGLVDSSAKFLDRTHAARMSIPSGVFTDKKTAPNKGQRIDFILTDLQLSKAVQSSTIVTSGVVNKISDHYPVISNFKFKVP